MAAGEEIRTRGYSLRSLTLSPAVIAATSLIHGSRSSSFSDLNKNAAGIRAGMENGRDVVSFSSTTFLCHRRL